MGDAAERPTTTRGVASFPSDPSDTRVEAESQKLTGDLPIMMGAQKLTDASGFYKEKL